MFSQIERCFYFQSLKKESDEEVVITHTLAMQLMSKEKKKPQ